MIAPTQRLLASTTEAERLSREINLKRRAMVDFDHKQRKNKEALQCIQRKQVPDKAWVHCGPFFLKLPTPTVKSVIEREQQSLSEDLEELRESLRADLAQLHEVHPSGKDDASIRTALRDIAAKDGS